MEDPFDSYRPASPLDQAFDPELKKVEDEINEDVATKPNAKKVAAEAYLVVALTGRTFAEVGVVGLMENFVDKVVVVCLPEGTDVDQVEEEAALKLT